MTRQRLDVVVGVSGNVPVEYNGWPTEARVDRRGNLRVYEGWRQRAYHPAGEWTFYSVSAPTGAQPGQSQPGQDQARRVIRGEG